MTVRPLAAVAMVVLMAAGCSKAPAATGNATSSTAGDIRSQAMTFSECMRHNGVNDFPDPDASGALTIDEIANRSSIDTNSAAFEQALTVCKSLEPPGFTGEKRTTEQQKAGLAFAQCIRDNGVKDFPDPTPDSPLIDTNRIPSTATDDGMAALHVAMQKCKGFASRMGVRSP